MLRATLNEAVPLEVLASDGRTDLFGRVKLYQGASLIFSFDLPHLVNGVYGVSWTPAVEGYYSCVYQLFLDIARTLPAPHDLESETIEVCSDKTNIMRILGLHHENAVLDQHVYNGANQLVSARLRVFKTKADAIAENVGAILFTYTIQAGYTTGLLSKFVILRDL